MLENILPLQTNSTNPQIIVDKMAPLFGDGNTMLIFSAVVFGLALQTIWGYWSEKKKGNPNAQAFDVDFFYTAVAAFVSAGIPAIALMPAATATFNSLLGQWGLVFSWLFTAAGVFGVNRAINKGYTTITRNTETKLVESGKLDTIIEKKVEEKIALRESNPKTTTEDQQPTS